MIFSKRNVHISIKNRSLRFIESGKRGSFYKYGQKCLPEGIIHEGQIKDRETFTLILEEMIHDWKLKGKNVSFCIPDSVVIVRKVKIPPEILDDEITGYLYMELGESIHLPFEDPVLEAVPIVKTEKVREAILVASRESVVNEYAGVFKESGLKPTVADLSLLSVYRTYYHIGLSNSEDHLLLVQVGLDYMLLSAFYQDQPVFVRHYPIEMTDEEVAIEKSRSGAEFYTWTGSDDLLKRKSSDIRLEIERFLSYYHFNFSSGNHTITKIVITGDHPCTDIIFRDISSTVNIDVQPLIEPLFQTKKGVNIPATYIDCIGLALK